MVAATIGKGASGSPFHTCTGRRSGRTCGKWQATILDAEGKVPRLRAISGDSENGGAFPIACATEHS
jgi:hypothetical protein